MLKVVQTESQSPFETLWRQFPQIKNATCVGRMSWAIADDAELPRGSTAGKLPARG